MGHADDTGVAQSGVVGEVRNVLGNFTAIQSFQHILFIHQLISGEVQEDHAILHQLDLFCVDHTLGGFHRRNVDGDVVALG